jgi:hypothetical protein
MPTVCCWLVRGLRFWGLTCEFAGVFEDFGAGDPNSEVAQDLANGGALAKGPQY